MPTQITLVPTSSYKVMPWKNGGGSTTELFIHPPEASVHEDFLWRISLARVDQSGPFSTFPGYDRTIVQLSGNPMHLMHAEQGEHALKALVPYQFQGEWNTTGTLSGGSVQDFNVMVKRSHAVANVKCVRFNAQASLPRETVDTQILWLKEGQCSVTVQDQIYSLLPQEALRIEPGGSEPVDLHGDAVLIIVSISRLQE